MTRLEYLALMLSSIATRLCFSNCAGAICTKSAILVCRFLLAFFSEGWESVDSQYVSYQLEHFGDMFSPITHWLISLL